MDAAWARLMLHANLVGQAALIAGALWCIAFPSRRIYPMSRPDAWWVVMWAIFAFVFVSNPVLLVLDWNSGLWHGPLRFWLGVPLFGMGTGLVCWGMATLGARRTSGLPQGLVTGGPYRFTRNPQYVGDAALFAGLAILANSQVVLVTHLLTALVLLLAPLAEEPWLEEQYGEGYRRYRASAPRYL